MPNVKVNADSFTFPVANPQQGMPPIARTVYFGEVVDLPEDEVKRGREVRIARHYPSVDSPGTVMRMEPALVDPDSETATETARRRQEADAKIAALQGELAALTATRPPTPAPERGVANPVTLGPATTGTRLIPEDPENMTAAEATAAGLPMAPVTEADLEASRDAERARLEGKPASKGARGSKVGTPPGSPHGASQGGQGAPGQPPAK